MVFAKPLYLILIPIVVAGMALVFAWSERRRQRSLKQLGNPALVRRLMGDTSPVGRWVQRALWLFAAVLILIALARPQWGEEVRVVERQGLQLVVALDVSTSMLAADVKPNRLERAKLEIGELMQELQGDEIALVLFSGSSFVQFPLTSDYATARTFLQGANPAAISRPGTNVGGALETALTAFDESSESQRVVVLITDGEAHDSRALDAARKLADKGVILYTVGFGSPDGATVPEFDFAGNMIGAKVDENGVPVISRLDEATLQEIARIGSGQYYHAASGTPVVPAIIEELAGLQRGAIGERSDVRRIERYQIFLALALVALVVSMLIPERFGVRRARGAFAASVAQQGIES